MATDSKYWALINSHRHSHAFPRSPALILNKYHEIKRPITVVTERGLILYYVLHISQLGHSKKLKLD